jgi:hypothetical protein
MNGGMQKLDKHTPVALADGDVSSLRQKTGMMRRISAAIATSAAAGDELARVEVERVRALGAIARTGLKLAEAKVKTALVAAAMPQIGALATSLNSATTAVDQALTNGSAAEVVTHLSNRSNNLAMVQELHKNGKISVDETGTLDSFATNDAAVDIERSRVRMAQAKDAVQHLHEYALASITRAKIGLDS